MNIFSKTKIKYIVLGTALIIVLAALFWPSSVQLNQLRQQTQGAQTEINPESTPLQIFRRIRVSQLISQEVYNSQQGLQITQHLKIQIMEGPEQGQEHDADYTGFSTSNKQPNLFAVGDRGVAARVTAGEEIFWEVVDHERTRPTLIIVGIFVIAALILGRWRGLTALLGLGFTITVVVYYLVPHILLGVNPLLVAMIGGIAIAAISMFLAHGFKARTVLAIISTCLALGLAVLASALAVKYTLLSGQTSSETVHLRSLLPGGINMQGLLLAGMIISVLGLLDDATIGQVVAIEQLYKANPQLTRKELYSRGLVIGREHIASLVNTLMLVYAGTALPLLLLFSVVTSQPMWVLFNSEYVSEELVRSAVGSTILILAIPLSTALACWYYKQEQEKDTKSVI